MSSFADPVRSQAIRWTAVQSLVTLERMKRGGAPDGEDFANLSALSDDLVAIAEWEGSFRTEASLASAVAHHPSDQADRLREIVFFDPVDFSAEETEHLRRAAASLREISRGQEASPEEIDSLEDMCSIVINKLAPQARLDSDRDLAGLRAI